MVRMLQGSGSEQHARSPQWSDFWADFVHHVAGVGPGFASFVVIMVTKLSLSKREFLGPIIGGSLTNVMSFQMSSVVSAKLDTKFSLC